ncbi:MAG: hypothetical protein JXJ22_01670, partial [Bacteroidales bacterium]|nr:hypothetical protein [Bacteroidales bacterium]
MKKFFLKIVFMVSLISLYCINAISSEIDTISFPSNHINYWSGSGNSEVFMVVDFNNDSLPESFIWGYRFNDSIKVNELIKAIDSVDQRLEVIYNGIYISDIIYDYKNNATDIYSAVGGSPDYFNMFVGKLDSLWDYNWNIGPDMYLKDGDYLGLSYTASDSNYNPLNYPDGNPASAKPIIDLDFNNIEYWLGSGDKQIALVIDFQSDITESALIWGIKYSSSITLIEAIKLVDSLDNRLTINYSGNYINDIIYDYYYDGTNLHTAYAGDPCWFNMYIGEDSMEWETNWGIGPTTVMENNQMIGLSYTPSDANYNAILTPSVIFEFAKEGLPYSVELAE